MFRPFLRLRRRRFRWLLWAAGLGALAVAAYLLWVPAMVGVHGPGWEAAPRTDGRLGLADYVATLQAQPIAGVRRNLSGLTWSDTTQTLFAVVNRPATLLELSPEGKLLRSWPVPGGHDTEGISHVEADLFVVADESGNRLHWLRVTAAGVQLLDAPAPQVRTEASVLDNAGIEGIAWDRRGERLLFGNERLPRQIFAVDAPLHARRVLAARPWEPQAWFGLLGNDVAGLAVDQRSGHLLVLSEASAVLTEYDTGGEIVGALPLWAGSAGLRERVPQAEGVAIAPDGTLYVVSEPNLFYRFAPASPVAAAPAAVP